LKKLVVLWRINDGRRESTSFCIIDVQSVHNADTVWEKGCDAGKKGYGIKRHIAVDTNGLPHAIHVTTANISDKADALETLENNPSSMSCVVNVLCDGGYSGKPFAEAVRQIIGANVQIVKLSEPHQFAVLRKRWIVERFGGTAKVWSTLRLTTSTFTWERALIVWEKFSPA